MSLCKACGRPEGDDAAIGQELPAFSIYRGCEVCDGVWIETRVVHPRCPHCKAIGGDPKTAKGVAGCTACL